MFCWRPFKAQNTDVIGGRRSGNYWLSKSILSAKHTVCSSGFPPGNLSEKGVSTSCSLLIFLSPFLILQLSAEDYSSMSRLLPPLETLSQKHSEVVIQELASNLRVVISTHGAYWPENLTAAAQPSRNPETTAKNSSVPFRKKQKMKTEANGSQTSPNSSSLYSNSPSNTHIRHPASSGGSVAGKSPKGGERTSGTSDPCPPTKPFSDWLLEACDPDVPTRAFALRILTQMVQNGNPEAVQAQEKVLTVGCFFYVLKRFCSCFSI